MESPGPFRTVPSDGGGGFYVEFAVGSTDSSCGRYSQYDELYRQYGYKYGTGDPNDDFYIKEYPAGSEEDMIREIPDLIVAIKGNCLSVCLYEDMLRGPEENVPMPPVKKKFKLFSENDGCLMVLFKLLLIGLIGGVGLGGILILLSQYVWN